MQAKLQQSVKLCYLFLDVTWWGTLRMISSPWPSDIVFLLCKVSKWMLFAVGARGLFFLSGTANESSSGSVFCSNFRFCTHLSHRHRESKTVFSFFFFSTQMFLKTVGLLEKRTLSNMLVIPNITNTGPRHFINKSVFWKTKTLR